MDLDLIGLRQFREQLDAQTKAVRVVKTRGEITVLGVWLPASAYDVIADGDEFRIVKKKHART